MRSWSAEFQLLRDRTFAILVITRLVSSLGAAGAPVALAFSVLHLPHGDAGLLSIVMACEAIPMLLFVLVGGVVADHFPRTRVFFFAQLLCGTAFFALGAEMLLGFTPLWALGLGSALSGSGIAMLGPVLSGIVPEFIEPERLQSANGLLGFARNTARVLGAVLAGILVAAIGGAQALLVSGALYVAGAFLTTLLPRSTGRGGKLSASGAFADLREGWSEFTARQWIWAITAQFSLLVFFFEGAHGVAGPVLADAELGGAVPWSWVLAGESLGSVLGVLIGMRLRPQRPILVSVLYLLVALPPMFLLLGLGAPLPLVIAAALLAGSCLSVFGVLWDTTMQRKVPTEALSRVSSYDALGSFLFGPLGLLVAGPITVAIGPRAAMLACGVAFVVIGLLPLLAPDVRHCSWDEADVRTDAAA